MSDALDKGHIWYMLHALAAEYESEGWGTYWGRHGQTYFGIDRRDRDESLCVVSIVLGDDGDPHDGTTYINYQDAGNATKLVCEYRRDSDPGKVLAALRKCVGRILAANNCEIEGNGQGQPQAAATGEQ